jgi:diadenylate cyclase
MENLDVNFLQVRFLDIVDILLVALIIYYVYNLIRGTIAVNIIVGLSIIYLGYLLVQQANMRMLSEILGGFVSLGFFALIVVFQQEIRRFLLLIGKNATVQRNKSWFSFLFGRNEELNTDHQSQIKPIMDACQSMQKTKTGALIVLAKYFEEQHLQNSGENLDAAISKRLLESIFQKHSPLHDGAVIITDNKIKSASCILPLTDNDRLPANFGLRHRAGIGISEVSDVLAIIISEESGEISYARQGRVKLKPSMSELEKQIQKYI